MISRKGEKNTWAEFNIKRTEEIERAIVMANDVEHL